MKKLLLIILIILLLTLGGYFAVKGLQIGNIEILGIQQIQDRSLELDNEIQKAAKLASKDYAQAVNKVKTDSKTMQNKKQEYEEYVQVSDSEDVEASKNLAPYEMGKLWIKLGNYAESEGTDMTMQTVSTGVEGTYNLKFTATGSYISIEDFISDIENDSELGFKIEEFKLQPSGSTETLQATFTCKAIYIKDITETSSSENEMEGQTDSSTDNKNTNTNTTNSTSTNNTNENSTNENSTNTNNSTNTSNTAS